MPEELLAEYTLSYPIGFVIKKQPGGRNRLTLIQNNKEDQVFNFYEPERIYTYGDDKTLSIGIAKQEQDPATIRYKLKRMAAEFKRGWRNATSGRI